MPTMLFCNIARMDSYRGWTSVDVPQGAGSHAEKVEVHNFHPHDGHVYGYVAAVARSISLEKLGAPDRSQLSVGSVDVIWTAPSTRRGRDVVGWYRDATVFRHLQTYERGSYHVSASNTRRLRAGQPLHRRYPHSAHRPGPPGLKTRSDRARMASFQRVPAGVEYINTLPRSP